MFQANLVKKVSSRTARTVTQRNPVLRGEDTDLQIGLRNQIHIDVASKKHTLISRIDKIIPLKANLCCHFNI